MNFLEFWNDVHRDGFDLWLTDTPPQAYIDDLRLDLSKPQRVLEIGVGRGLMVEYLLRNGHRVTACDISPTALSNLPAEAQTALIDYLPELGTRSHDIGISYLTIQHMDLHDVVYAIREAVRICGKFKFQMASMIDSNLGIREYDGPMFMRPVDDIMGVVDDITLTELGQTDHASQNIRWHYVEAA